MLLDGHLEGSKGTRLGWREPSSCNTIASEATGGHCRVDVSVGDPHSNESLNTGISPEGCILQQGSSLQLKAVPGEELGVIHQWSVFPLQWWWVDLPGPLQRP